MGPYTFSLYTFSLYVCRILYVMHVNSKLLHVIIYCHHVVVVIM